jgi:4-aminobutyrate aminotransferase-like enzyme
MYEPYVELVSRLCALAGDVNTHKGVLFTTGAEAIKTQSRSRARTRDEQQSSRSAAASTGGLCLR